MGDRVYYLTTHPPARRQFYNPRRGGTTPSGAIVVHTAESATDLVLPDTGAEGVARYISTRDTPGSYHVVVDSDSIVWVGAPAWEMFGEGTGGNRWALHVSFACRADGWGTLPESWVAPAIANGAAAAVELASWLRSTYGIVVPAGRITPAQYRAGRPGFISHAELDPGRRSDPGVGFPWDRFLAAYATGAGVGAPTTTTGGTMEVNPYVKTWQEQLLATGLVDLGSSGADGKFGPGTLAGSSWYARHLEATIANTPAKPVDLAGVIADVDALAGRLRDLAAAA